MPEETTDEVVEDQVAEETHVEESLPTDDIHSSTPETEAEPNSGGEDNLDPELLDYAVQSGLSPDYLMANNIASQEAMDQHDALQLQMYLNNQRNQQPQPQQQQAEPQEPEAPSGWEYQPFEGTLSAEEYGPEIAEFLNNSRQHDQGQLQALNEYHTQRYEALNQQLEQVTNYLQQQYEAEQSRVEQQRVSEFDQAIAQLPEQWQQMLGVGPTASLNHGTPHYTNREMMYPIYLNAVQGMGVGRNITPERAAMLAVGIAFPQAQQQFATQQVTNEVKKRQAQAISKPSQTKEVEGSPKERAMRRIKNVLDEAGARG